MRHKRPSSGLIGAGLLWLFVGGSMLDGTIPIPVALMLFGIAIAHFAVYGYQHLLWIDKHEENQ